MEKKFKGYNNRGECFIGDLLTIGCDLFIFPFDANFTDVVHEVKDNKPVINLKYEVKKGYQFIGRTDKNGREIYEGDVVKPFPEDDYAQIIFLNGAFKIATKRKNGNYLCWNYIKEEIEIIGNIHENPELIK